VTPDFKDPLGVKDPLSAAAEDESDEFDFDVRFICRIGVFVLVGLSCLLVGVALKGQPSVQNVKISLQ
jgi:hypothetical protein